MIPGDVERVRRRVMQERALSPGYVNCTSPEAGFEGFPGTSLAGMRRQTLPGAFSPGSRSSISQMNPAVSGFDSYASIGPWKVCERVVGGEADHVGRLGHENIRGCSSWRVCWQRLRLRPVILEFRSGLLMSKRGLNGTSLFIAASVACPWKCLRNQILWLFCMFLSDFLGWP